MAVLSVQNTSLAGSVLTTAAAAGGGDSFAAGPDENYFLQVTNGGGGSINVIINDPNTASPAGATAFNPDVTVAVAASATKTIKLASPRRFIDTTTGRIDIAYSSATSVTVAVFK